MSDQQHSQPVPAPRKSGDHVAPAEAFQFATRTEFAKDATKERDKNGNKEYPVTVTARRGGVVDHWYWGRIVHNLSGVRTKDRVALDWCHTDEVIGYADSIDASSGALVLSGKLVSIRDDDRADEVGRKGQAGIPFESSIFWDPYTAEIHYLQEGATESVNGQTIEGPCYVVDAWDLRGQAICAYGVDNQTKTQFSAGLPASVPLKVREASMSAAATKDSAKDGATTTDKSTGTGAGQVTTTSTATSTTDSSRSDLRRYMDKFGDAEGAKYFADGLSYEAALEKHCDALNAKVKTAQDAQAETQKKLDSLDRGADSAITTTASGASGQGKDNQAKKGLESLIKFK